MLKTLGREVLSNYFFFRPLRKGTLIYNKHLQTHLIRSIMSTNNKIKKLTNYSILMMEVIIGFLIFCLTLDIVEESRSLLTMLQNLLFWWIVCGVILLALECGRYRVRSYV